MNDDVVEKDESFNITLELTSGMDIVVDLDRMNGIINVQDDDREFLPIQVYIDSCAIINPRRACAARVTVVGSLCVCVCVCVCVCLSVC